MTDEPMVQVRVEDMKRWMKMEAKRDKLREGKLKAKRRAEKAEIKAANYANFNHEWRQRAEAAEAKMKTAREALYDAESVLSDWEPLPSPGASRMRQALALIDHPGAPEVTTQEAAQVLLDMLNVAEGKPKLCQSERDNLWHATAGETGFVAVNGFLRALAGKDTDQ